jgi:Fic family protein
MSHHQVSLKESKILNLFLDSNEDKVAIEKCAMRISISKLKSTLVSDFSRADFESVTGFPRSTASRFLKNWLNQEILVRTGAGKATSYNFK